MRTEPGKIYRAEVTLYAPHRKCTRECFTPDLGDGAYDDLDGLLKAAVASGYYYEWAIRVFDGPSDYDGDILDAGPAE